MLSRHSRLRVVTPLVIGLAVALTPLASAHASDPAARGFHVYTDPNDREYLERTCLVDLSGFAELEVVTEITQCGQAITVSPDVQKKNKVEHWGDPHENLNGKHVKLTFSSPISHAGVIAAPDSLDRYRITSTYYGQGATVGTISRKVSGDAGERLFAASSKTPFDSIDVTIEGEVNVAVAQIRIDATLTSATLAGYEIDGPLPTAVIDGPNGPCTPYTYVMRYKDIHGNWITHYVTVICVGGIAEYHWYDQFDAPGARTAEFVNLGSGPIVQRIKVQNDELVAKIENTSTGQKWTFRGPFEGHVMGTQIGITNLDEFGNPQPLPEFGSVTFPNVKIGGVPLSKIDSDRVSKVTMIDETGRPQAAPTPIARPAAFNVNRI